VAFDGPFVIRAFAGGAGRANAASSLDPSPNAGLVARVARIETYYEALGLVPRFRSMPLDPPGLAELLASRGYDVKGEVVILSGPLPGDGVMHQAASIRPAPDAEWIAVSEAAKPQSPERWQEKVESPELLLAPQAWITLSDGGGGMAAISAVVTGGLLGFFDVAVRPEKRRRGFARSAVLAAACWGRKQGAAWIFCHVSAGNAAMLALCTQLGMREAYRYRYLVRT
jgi:GNAT superfamily N-acetyltransferase